MVSPKDIIHEEEGGHKPSRVLSSEVRHEDAMSHIAGVTGDNNGF